MGFRVVYIVFISGLSAVSPGYRTLNDIYIPNFRHFKLKTAKMGSCYFEELSVDNKKRYEEKLTLKNGVYLGDPYAIEDGWSDDITKLPNLSWSEITKYLIETPSFYTNEAIKAFKSLEGYEFFREGHVQDCFHHEGAASQPFCFIKSKVSAQM